MKSPDPQIISGNQKNVRATEPVTSRPIALTIAGFDPSSGAGITADLKTFAAHNVYGVAGISALTVQSTQGVRSIQTVSAPFLRQTLDYLADDLPLAGIKIGMLGSFEIAKEVSSFLKTSRVEIGHIVLDPVLRSTSGLPLMDREGTRLLREQLLGCIGWITPNLEELASLTGSEAIGRQAVPAAAERLKSIALGQGNEALNVVVTGGHLDRPDDFLLTALGERIWISGERVSTRATHGTGCAFSSALLCQLISGDSPVNAVTNAKAYIGSALRSAYPIGRGRGPMNHLFRFDRG